MRRRPPDPRRPTLVRLLALALALAPACGEHAPDAGATAQRDGPVVPQEGTVAFTGARIFDGTGGPLPISSGRSSSCRARA